MIIEISGPERPVPESVIKMEDMLRKKTGEQNLTLIIRYYKSDDITRNGRNLFGVHYSGTEPPLSRKIEKRTSELIDEIRNIFPVYIEAQKMKKVWHIMADVTGERLVKSKEVKDIEKKLGDEFAVPVKLYIYSKTEGVVEDDGLKPLELFSKGGQAKRLNDKFKK